MNQVSEEREIAAQNVYEDICEMLKDTGRACEKHDEDKMVACTVQGEDLPMEILFAVFAAPALVQLSSPMPFLVPEERRTDVALAITYVNNRLIEGAFDFDLSVGRICYRMTDSFLDAEPSKAQWERMLATAARTTDDYNDKFLEISEGKLSLKAFMEG